MMSFLSDEVLGGFLRNIRHEIVGNLLSYERAYNDLEASTKIPGVRPGDILANQIINLVGEFYDTGVFPTKKLAALTFLFEIVAKGESFDVSSKTSESPE